MTTTPPTEGDQGLSEVQPRQRGRLSPWLWVCGAVLLMLVLNTGIGPVAIRPGEVIRILLSRLPFLDLQADWPQTFETILFQIRLPHTLLMVLTGMALGGSGAAFQGLFRNPLADPYIIGVASGAGLGAVVAIAIDWPVTWMGMAIVPAAAFVGGLLTVMIVYALARVGKSTPVTTLILAGVAVGTFTSALTSLILLVSTDQIQRAVVWLLGGFSLGGWEPVIASLPYLIIGLIFLMLLGRPLNVLQFGDEQALQLGLNVERVKLLLVAAASLVAAVAVSFSGIIGFVGLIVPHLIRLLWGTDYRRLIPLATLGGGAVLLASDTLARTLLAPRELPVGIITSLLGAPFFLWLLRKARVEEAW
ncbi:MAG TPA: iron ABC transporter permease [Anaerolineae bacterium]|nr:iron ABC transporter permease [Anaerolineae bacterium]